MKKLSDEIVLGSTLITLDPTVYLSRFEDCGCLIGMGAKSMGKKVDDIVVQGKFGREFVFPEYPWLFQVFPQPDNLVEAQGRQRAFSYAAYMIIGQMASCIKQGTYTFEQALEWIRANEPQDTAPELTSTPKENTVCVS